MMQNTMYSYSLCPPTTFINHITNVFVHLAPPSSLHTTAPQLSQNLNVLVVLLRTVLDPPQPVSTSWS